MALRQTLESDMKQALREGDRTRLSVLRLALSSIHNAEIAKGGALDDAEIINVLQKEAKTRRESIEEFGRGGRQDLVAKEQAELALIESYLPQQLSSDELRQIVRRVVNEVGAQGPRDIAKVMPRLMAEVRGRVDGRQANQVVQEVLASL